MTMLVLFEPKTGHYGAMFFDFLTKNILLIYSASYLVAIDLIGENILVELIKETV